MYTFCAAVVGLFTPGRNTARGSRNNAADLPLRDWTGEDPHVAEDAAGNCLGSAAALRGDMKHLSDMVRSLLPDALLGSL